MNEDTPPQLMPEGEVPPAPEKQHRIVVAEDEALIRMDLTEMLIEAGHDVVGPSGRRSPSSRDGA